MPGGGGWTEEEGCTFVDDADALPEDVERADWLPEPVDFAEDGVTEGETLVAVVADLVED